MLRVWTGEFVSSPLALLCLRYVRQSTATPGAARYTFTAEWEDNFSKLVRTFNLMFWEEDNSVEVRR